MKVDYLITIHVTMEQYGGSDSVQLMTRGLSLIHISEPTRP